LITVVIETSRPYKLRSCITRIIGSHSDPRKARTNTGAAITIPTAVGKENAEVTRIVRINADSSASTSSCSFENEENITSPITLDTSVAGAFPIR
jgi:hypothetical protein